MTAEMNHRCFSRRGFLAGIIPACALTCLGLKGALAGGPVAAAITSEEAAHKFDSPFERELTNRQVIGMRYGDFLRFAKAMEKEIGKEKLIELIKEEAWARGLEVGKRQLERSPDASLQTYVAQFKSPRYDNALTMEIIEDTDEAFEIKVTECLWASVFLAQDAGDIGNAWVCHADYSWAQGFNPKIELVRDKTLTLGHSICNHRYVWKG